MQSKTLRRVLATADYQFGRGIGSALFRDGEISLSRRTGRPRHLYADGQLLATLRPTDGLFSLTVEGAQRLFRIATDQSFVIVQHEVADFVAKGRSVFAKHVLDCDSEIRPGEEVIILDDQCEVLAVGKAVLTGCEMVAFMRGIAVRVRRGKLEREVEKVKKEK